MKIELRNFFKYYNDEFFMMLAMQIIGEKENILANIIFKHFIIMFYWMVKNKIIILKEKVEI